MRRLLSQEPERPPPPVPHLELAWDAGAAGDDPAEPIEDRLARLAAAVGPLRRLLAAIAGRLIEKKAPERLCYACLGDYARELAERAAGRRLRTGEVLEFVAAEVFSAISIDPAFAGRPEEPPAPLRSERAGSPEEGKVSEPRARPRGLSRTIASLAAGLDGADAFELDRRLRLAVRLEQTLDAAIAPLLRCVTSPEYEWRPVWVAWAERVTVRRLEQDVERALLLRAGHSLAWHRCKFHPERAQDPIPPEERQMCAPEIDTEATQQLAWRVPCDVAELFNAVRETLRAKLWPECGRLPADGEVFDALLDCALLAWTLRDPRARRPDPVIERESYRCAVPGCTSRRNLHDHHLTFRSAGGSNSPGNRISLCAFHHQRCLHVGLMRIRGRASDGLVSELGLRRGTPPLVSYRSGDIEVPRIEASSLARPRRAA